MGFSQSPYVTEGLKGYQQLGNAAIPRMIASLYDSIKIL